RCVRLRRSVSPPVLPPCTVRRRRSVPSHERLWAGRNHESQRSGTQSELAPLQLPARPTGAKGSDPLAPEGDEGSAPSVPCECLRAPCGRTRTRADDLQEATAEPE